MGYALFLAQAVKRHATMAKTLKGFGGGTVVEVKESYGADGDIKLIEKRLKDLIEERERRL